MAKTNKDTPHDPNMLRLENIGDIPTYFADYIESRISGEEAILTFCRRDYDQPLKTAIPLARVYITLPHYCRFGNMISENIKKIIEAGIIVEGRAKNDSDF